MKKIFLFTAITALALNLSSCMIEGEASPSVNVKELSTKKVLFLKSASCSRSAAAERYLRQSFETWKEEFNLPSDARLESYVDFIELDENAPGFNMSEAKDYLKSAEFYYNLDDSDGSIPTPIICFGENNICGWNYRDEGKVDVWIKHYLEIPHNEWKTAQ